MKRALTCAAFAAALTLAAAIPGGAAAVAAAAPAVTASSPATPFSLSGLPAESRGPAVATTPVTAGSHPAAPRAKTALATGTPVDVIGSNDVVQQATINGTAVHTCNPGKDTAQNETTIASSGSTLIAGANDYRLYEPSENRYDASGGFYRSIDNGGHWTAGFLPGLVRANPIAPGPYEAAGDPAVVTGPDGSFWYANLAFDRTDDANSVAVSRSTDGGVTWHTHFVVQTPASRGHALFNDKEWIGTDPANADVAYVAWTQFEFNSSAIVISKTTDGGATWSAPMKVADQFPNSQGATVVVSSTGTVYVTFETFNGRTDAVVFAVSSNGGASFSSREIAPIHDVPSPLPGATWRDDSFPMLAIDGSTLHIAWPDWNGTSASVVYMRSTDGGASWSSPVVISGSGNNVMPWLAARGGKVYASWFTVTGNNYTIAAAASVNDGASWSAPVTLSDDTSMPATGNLFGFPNCAASFIGDYSGIVVDSAGVGHSLWTDIAPDANDPPGGGADQDPYTNTLTAG